MNMTLLLSNIVKLLCTSALVMGDIGIINRCR